VHCYHRLYSGHIKKVPLRVGITKLEACPLTACCYIPFRPTQVYVKQPAELVASEVSNPMNEVDKPAVLKESLVVVFIYKSETCPVSTNLKT
jgi:hypothetical protein